jgi:aspartate racemase
MIGILGGMGTQAGLDFCNKLAIINRGKVDQDYPLFILYNKSNIPGRPESIGLHAKSLSIFPKKPKNIRKYHKVLKSLIDGCQSLEKSGCKFIVIPCNTAHYWYDDLKKIIKVPIINMPKEVYLHTKKKCKKNSKIGLLATEGTLNTGVYNKFFDKDFIIIKPTKSLQTLSVNKAIKYVKMGKVKEAEKIIRSAVNYLTKMKCKKIILGCTELPLAIFAYKSFKKVKLSKTYLDPNLILAFSTMKKYKKR